MPPSLHLEAGKEGIYFSDHMFKNQMLFFLLWLVEKQYGWDSD